MLLSEQQYGDIPHNESNRRGKRFVDQSLALDENLAEGYAALGLYYGRTPAEAEIAIDHLMKALSINPNLVDAGNWLQTALNIVGDHKGAMDILTELVERDPLYRPAFSNAMMTFNAFGAQDKAEELLHRMESFDPANPDLHMARAVNLMYSGRNGEGLQEMELRRESGEMSGVARIFLSIGLMSTLQFERSVEEGSLYLKPTSLYNVGRKDEGLDLAREQATSGYPESYFYLLNREGRYKDVVSFLEERWPTLATFASENGSDAYGYTIMTEVAHAYSKVGNQQRFNEAMELIERHFASIDEQEVDNFITDANHAIAFAMLGDFDAAIPMLDDAVRRGWSPIGKPTEVIPQLDLLADDPRFHELELAMLANVNRDREVVGLLPVDFNYQVVEAIPTTN